MNRAVYTATSGGMAAFERLESVAHNLANVNTAGYKASRLLFRVRPLEETAAGPNPGAIAGDTAAQVVQVATMRDFTQGAIRSSGNPLDVAIDGDGFFVVQ